MVEPLMGWTSSTDMKSQIRLRFATKEEAIAYCEREGIPYQVFEPKEPARRSMAYADNFAFTAPRALDALGFVLEQPDGEWRRSPQSGHSRIGFAQDALQGCTRSLTHRQSRAMPKRHRVLCPASLTCNA